MNHFDNPDSWTFGQLDTFRTLPEKLQSNEVSISDIDTSEFRIFRVKYGETTFDFLDDNESGTYPMKSEISKESRTFQEILHMLDIGMCEVIPFETSGTSLDNFNFFGDGNF